MYRQIKSIEFNRLSLFYLSSRGSTTFYIADYARIHYKFMKYFEIEFTSDIARNKSIAISFPKSIEYIVFHANKTSIVSMLSYQKYKLNFIVWSCCISRLREEGIENSCKINKKKQVSSIKNSSL